MRIMSGVSGCAFDRATKIPSGKIGIIPAGGIVEPFTPMGGIVKNH
jgi:hypothetical protein